jgi:hypothetical protein
MAQGRCQARQHIVVTNEQLVFLLYERRKWRVRSSHCRGTDSHSNLQEIHSALQRSQQPSLLIKHSVDAAVAAR